MSAKPRVLALFISVDNEKKRADTFESNLIKLNEGIIKLKSLRKRDQIAIQNLEDYKKTQTGKERFIPQKKCPH